MEGVGLFYEGQIGVLEDVAVGEQLVLEVSRHVHPK